MSSEPQSTPGTITGLIQNMQSGDRKAADALFVLVQDQLRQIARNRIAAAGSKGSLQVTAIVNEACVRLFEREALDAENRRHFFFLFNRAIRDVLCEAVRMEGAQKRGAQFQQVPLGEFEEDGRTHYFDLLDLNEALMELQQIDPDCARIIDLRFFNNLTMQEAAETMGWSLAMARRNWDYAKAWLFERLSRERGNKE